MEIELRAVTLVNRGELDGIDPGPTASSWVHAPWYWHQVSLDRPDVEFRLVYVPSSPTAVAMVAYGPAYADRDLTRPIPGRYELAHLVVDWRWHRRGVGRAVAQRILAVLSGYPDCHEVVIAHHPDNQPSRQLFTNLGLTPCAEQNYDGDAILIAPAEALRHLSPSR